MQIQVAINMLDVVKEIKISRTTWGKQSHVLKLTADDIFICTTETTLPYRLTIEDLRSDDWIMRMEK